MITIDDLLIHLTKRLEAYCELGNSIRRGEPLKIADPELLFEGATPSAFDSPGLKLWEQLFRLSLEEAPRVFFLLSPGVSSQLTTAQIRRIQQLLWRYESGLRIALRNNTS